MLQNLSIHDFVIVDSLNLEFERGFTVLTGETGAGKSILIDALSLALGARAESGVTRTGCDKAEISANFDISQNLDAKEWLAINEMANDEPELILRRVLYADGRTRAFINGVAATVQQLKELGEFLVDIYSQNAHHSLLKLITQRAILDEFAGLSLIAADVATRYKTWHRLNLQKQEIEKNSAAYADEFADLLDKTRELAQLSFDLDEWESLQQEHVRLSHGASLLSGCEEARDWLSEGELSVTRLLAQVQHKLQDLREFDASLDEAIELVSSAEIQLNDADRFLNRYLQRTELDPERLNEVEIRIQAVHGIARKYRIRPEELPELLSNGQARMTELEGLTNNGELEKQEAQALLDYISLAQQLSGGRAQAAKALSIKITAEMQRLSLSGGKFEVQLTAQASAATGLEQVEFLVAGHAGVAARSLNKVASGGELSRISLAIRVATAQQASIGTMIFDEVDVGIGGGVAETVGQLLKKLAEGASDKSFQRQVLVITHLPQVASQGAQHLRVSKSVINNQTLSNIEILDEAMRVEEIARMLGGMEITDTTRLHATEMLGF